MLGGRSNAVYTYLQDVVMWLANKDVVENGSLVKNIRSLFSHETQGYLELHEVLIDRLINFLGSYRIYQMKDI